MPILVIDDDHAIRELLFEQLSESGYDVSLAEGGIHALEVLATRVFALILSDIAMEPLDGFALLRETRARMPEIPVVLMSTYAPVGIQERTGEAGAAAFLRKPFTHTELLAVVRRVRPE